MKDTHYAYCVARLRANEKNFLGKEYLLKLCQFKSSEEGIDRLFQDGWIKEKGTVKEITDKKYRELWTLLTESVPAKKELDVFCIVNDFFNIKTAVKCSFSSLDPDDYYVYPTSVALDKLTEKAAERSYSSLGGILGRAADEAYRIACLTENGQSAEIIADRYAIDCLYEYSQGKKSGIIKEISAFICDTANIKIAMRINSLGKSRDFAESAIGECCSLSKKTLTEKALGEREDLVAYLMNTRYAEGVALYEKSGALYDKWCDDSIIKIASKAKFTCFGFDPICAHYYSGLNEIKSVKIILNALDSGLDADIIRERIRLLYA